MTSKGHIMVKISKTMDKGRILKQQYKNVKLHGKKSQSITLTTNFSADTPDQKSRMIK